MIKVANIKEEVDVCEMYGKESTISREEFIKKYKVNENRTFRFRGRRTYMQFRIK